MKKQTFGQRRLRMMRRYARGDYQTPPIALVPLLRWVPKDWVIWECAAGKGYLVDTLRSLGYKVFASDVITGQNFLDWEMKKPYDIILTNPPFVLKNEFIERCYELKKPWALLMPLTSLETARRQKMYREHGLQLICFPNRLDFEPPADMKIKMEGSNRGAWFSVAWFTHGLKLPKDIIFELMEGDQEVVFSVDDA